MLRVRDIMTRDVISVPGQAPLDVAAWRLVSEVVGGAPVRDARGNVIGVLSRSDFCDPRRTGEAAERVEDVMTPGVWAVHPDDDVLDAVALMLEKGIHRVLAIDAPDRVVGIVTTTDILQALLDGRFRGHPRAAKQDPADGDDKAGNLRDVPAGGVP